MKTLLIRLLAIQAVTGLAIAAGFYVWIGAVAALSVAYGLVIALVVSSLLALRMSQAARPHAGLGSLYLGALERMLFVGAAFALGMALFGLAPLAILAGFMGAEFAYFIAAGPFRRYMVEMTGSKNNGG